MPRDGLLSGKALLAQAKAYNSVKRRVGYACKFIQGAAWNMVMNLNYYNRRGKELQTIIDGIKKLAATLPEATAIDQVMGIEGNIRQLYYSAFDLILDDFKMGQRSKQPPQNEVNALISFGNMMCYTETLRAIHQTQLNPTISFLHTPGERRYSLCLDISEIFKPIIVDRVIFKVLNKHALSERDFVPQAQPVSAKRQRKEDFRQSHGGAIYRNVQAPLFGPQRKLSPSHQAGVLQTTERHTWDGRIQTV